MYSFDLGEFHLTLKEVRHAISLLEQRKATEDPDTRISDPAIYSEMLEVLANLCATLELVASRKRVARVEALLKSAPTIVELYHSLLSLDETVEDELAERWCYLYPPPKWKLLASINADWESVLKAFPSAKEDVFDGVDCFGCGKNTASVFHMMRVAEYGLRAVAHERKIKLGKGKPIEWGTWGEVLVGLEGATKELAKLKAGPVKDAALEFYSGVRGEMIAFKDVYRNNVMHTRRAYSEADAFRAINQVHDFMDRVSSKLTEHATRIRWAGSR